MGGAQTTGKSREQIGRPDLFHAEVERNHQWNTVMLVLNACVFHLGFTFLQASTIVVAYLKHYTDNAVLLNLPVFIMNFGIGVGPLIAGFYSPRFPRKKPPLIGFSVVQRFFLFPILIVVYFWSGAPRVIVPVFFASYAMYNLSWGFSYFFWQEMLSRIVLPEKRATALALRDSFSKISGLLGSLLSVYLLGRFPFPRNFTLCFAVGVGALALAMVFYLPIREAAYVPKARLPRARYFRGLAALPREDPDFKWFTVFVLFSAGTHFIGGLYTSVGIDRFGVEWGEDRLAGIFAVVSGVSGIVMAPVVGRIHDRFGRFWGFLPGIAFSVIVPLIAIAARSFPAMLAVFVLRGVAMSRWYLEISTVLSFAEPEKQHRYIAYIGVVKLLPIMLYTNLGGVLANSFSASATFAVSSALCLGSLAILVFVLRPRWKGSARAARAV